MGPLLQNVPACCLAAIVLVLLASPEALAMQAMPSHLFGGGRPLAVAGQGQAAAGVAAAGAAQAPPMPCPRSPNATYVVALIFAGRRDRMRINLAYLDRLVAACQLHEVHIWNSTRTAEDARWVQGLVGRRAYSVFFPDPETFPTSRDRWFAAYTHYGTGGGGEGGGAGKWTERFKPRWEGASPGNVVIVKLDDDIVYIDTDQFSGFADFVRGHSEMFLVHANIVNNGVAAFYQAQSNQQLRARLPGLVAYRYDKDERVSRGKGGPLYGNGSMALELHKLFLQKPELFSTRGPLGEACIVYGPAAARGVGRGQGRFSVNFFGARWAAWRGIAHASWMMRLLGSDERFLTEVATMNFAATECIYAPFHVAHLSFSEQLPVADEALPLYEDALGATGDAEF